MPNHHPNKPVLARPKVSLVKTLWSFWPLVAWLGVIAFCFWAHNQGVKFRRMNAAVDVYQENVSPTRDGFLDKLAPGVTRGTFVNESQVVAYLRSDELAEQRALLETEIELERLDKVRDLTVDIEKLKMDALKYRTDELIADTEAKQSEESARAWEQAQRDRIESYKKSASAELRAMFDAQLKNLPPDPEAQKARTDGAKAAAKASGMRAAIKLIEAAVAVKEGLRTQFEAIKLDDPKNLELVATAGQKTQLMILEDRKKNLELKATKSGIVDRINKEPGEYVKAGEGVLKIVGGATQIVAFLPQDQLNTLKVGQKVYLTATNQRKVLLDANILYLAPRLNTVPDATSPIPNKRLFGQDVIISYPPDSNMLPGQTVVVHLEDPRNVPVLSEWINRIFSNDDLIGTP